MEENNKTPETTTEPVTPVVTPDVITESVEASVTPAAEEATSTAEVMPAEEKKGTNKTLMGVLIGCGVLLLCVVCCCLSVFLGFGTLFKTAYSQYNDVSTTIKDICNASDSELRNIYDTQFTTDFKKKESFTTFKNFYNANKDILGNCDGYVKQDISFQDLMDGFSFQSNITNGVETTYIKIPLKNDFLELSLKKENGKWKIDGLEISEKTTTNN